ncbi:DUF58 domain-containing protein [Heyndrickxia sporothermodurans]
MEWRKEIINTSHIFVARTVLIFLIVLSFLLGNKWVLFTSLAGTIILYLHKFYFWQLGKNFHLDNTKELSRMNIDEEGEWLFTFINKGYPIVKGTLSISFDDCIEPHNYTFIKDRSFINISVPFKAWANEQVQVRIPFVAMKRGVSHIYRLEVKIQHLYGSGAVILNYNKLFKKRKIVYPRRKVLSSLKNQPVLLHGFQDSRTSLFSDPLQPIGTREYVRGDSFQHIHWKASARMHQLQTKVFPLTGARTWLFLFNISAYHYTSKDLEDLISYMAFLIEIAIKENIPFAIAVNVPTYGEIPYFYLSEGEGRIQRQKAFEMLSMISLYSFPYHYHFMLKDLEKRVNSFPIVIHVGETTSEAKQILLTYKMKNSTILEVKTVNGQGVMKEWKHYRTESQG